MVLMNVNKAKIMRIKKPLDKKIIKVGILSISLKTYKNFNICAAQKLRTDVGTEINQKIVIALEPYTQIKVYRMAKYFQETPKCTNVQDDDEANNNVRSMVNN